MERKKCKKCGEEKPLTAEYFSKEACKKDGFRSTCKSCRKQYYEKKKGPVAEYNKENKARRSEYLKENKDQISKRRKQYRIENKETVYGYIGQWHKENPDKCRIIRQRSRARKRELLSTLTAEQWETIKQAFNSQCAYCGEPRDLTQEHFIPLSKRGEYTHNNIIPACRSCNSSKNTKDFFEWYPKYEHYSKKRERKILKFLNIKNGIQQLTLAL